MSQGSMHEMWKKCSHGSCLAESLSWNDSMQTEHSSLLSKHNKHCPNTHYSLISRSSSLSTLLARFMYIRLAFSILKLRFSLRVSDRNRMLLQPQNFSNFKNSKFGHCFFFSFYFVFSFLQRRCRLGDRATPNGCKAGLPHLLVSVRFLLFLAFYYRLLTGDNKPCELHEIRMPSQMNSTSISGEPNRGLTNSKIRSSITYRQTTLLQSTAHDRVSNHLIQAPRTFNFTVQFKTMK